MRTKPYAQRWRPAQRRSSRNVVMGTEFRVDIGEYGILSEALLTSIQQMGGHQQLNASYETSVPGLHFVGAPASYSLGTLMRFVAGADFAARSVARHAETVLQPESVGGPYPFACRCAVLGVTIDG